jgi:dihydroorotase
MTNQEYEDAITEAVSKIFNRDMVVFLPDDLTDEELEEALKIATTIEVKLF